MQKTELNKICLVEETLHKYSIIFVVLFFIANSFIYLINAESMEMKWNGENIREAEEEVPDWLEKQEKRLYYWYGTFGVERVQGGYSQKENKEKEERRPGASGLQMPNVTKTWGQGVHRENW